MDTAQQLEARSAAGTSTDSTEPKSGTDVAPAKAKKPKASEAKTALVVARAAQQVASSSTYAKVTWIQTLIALVRGDMAALDKAVKGAAAGSVDRVRSKGVSATPLKKAYWKLVRAIKGNGEGRALCKRIRDLPVVERARALEELMTPGALEHNQPLLDAMTAALRRYDVQVGRAVRQTAEVTQEKAALNGACDRLVRSVAALRLATAAAEQLAIRSGEIQPTRRKRQNNPPPEETTAPGELTVVPAE